MGICVNALMVSFQLGLMYSVIFHKEVFWVHYYFLIYINDLPDLRALQHVYTDPRSLSTELLNDF